MESEAKGFETPDDFLSALANSLEKREGIDAELVKILQRHVLKASPDRNAVAHAKEAIINLARERGNSKMVGGANG